MPLPECHAYHLERRYPGTSALGKIDVPLKSERRNEIDGVGEAAARTGPNSSPKGNESPAIQSREASPKLREEAALSRSRATERSASRNAGDLSRERGNSLTQSHARTHA